MGFGDDFFGYHTRKTGNKRKVDNLDFIKIKNLCASKDNIKGVWKKKSHKMGAAPTGEPVLQLEKPVHRDTEPASSRARAPRERPTQCRNDPVQPKILKKEREKIFESQRVDSLVKTLMLGGIGGRRRRGRQSEMAGWHHWLDGHEFGWTPGVGDGQGDLACCDSWGRKESDTTERLNRTVW